MFCSKSGNDLSARTDVAETLHQALRNNQWFCCIQLLITISARINTLSRHARLAPQSACPAKASKIASSILAIFSNAKTSTSFEARMKSCGSVVGTD